MNSRERILKVFNHEIPDKVPVTPRFDTKWFQNAGPEYTEKIIKTTDLALYVDTVPDYVLYLGEETRKNLIFHDDGNRKTETIRTPKGEIKRTLRLEKYMMDWATEHFFKSPEDIEKALSIPYAPPELDFSDYEKWNKRIGNEGIVGVHLMNALCCPGLWLNPEDFIIYACVSHTNLVREITAKVNENLKQFVHHCLNYGIRHFLMAGAELCSQTIMGPEWFSRLVAPFDRELIETVKSGGGYVWYHCHGKIARIHKEMSELGFDVLTPCEKPPHGDITLRELKNSIGKKVALAGNLDDLMVLATGDRDMIERETISCLKQAKENGGFLLGGAEGCVFSPENANGYLWMCEVRDKYGRY